MAAKPAPAKTLKQPAKKVRKRNQTLKGEGGGMQLVLVDDVAFVGKQGQVVEVKPGYGRNYLLPNGLAVIPSQHNLKVLEKHKIKVQKAREARVADLKGMAEQIGRTQRITIEANSNEEGHLFGSVGPVEISKALRGKNLLVEPDMIPVEQGEYVFPFKECGMYSGVKLHLGYGIETSIEVAVIPQVTGRK
jgi:large subunit ribosomal protein L9